MSLEHIQPKGLFKSEPLGFTQVVTSPPGKLVFVSGQVGWDENMKIVGPGDLGAQALQAVRNLEQALAAVGATFEHLAHVRVYVPNYTSACLKALGPALGALKGQGKPAAQTLIGVQSLAMPELLIEIEATAVLPSGLPA